MRIYVYVGVMLKSIDGPLEKQCGLKNGFDSFLKHNIRCGACVRVYACPCLSVFVRTMCDHGRVQNLFFDKFILSQCKRIDVKSPM